MIIASEQKLVFNYTAGMHDVQVVSAAEYAGCLTSSGKKYTSGSDIVPLPEAGDYYFLCSFNGHCILGMSVTVTVEAAALAPPPPSTFGGLFPPSHFSVLNGYGISLAPAPLLAPPPPSPSPSTIGSRPPTPMAGPPAPMAMSPPVVAPVPLPAVALKSQAGLNGGVCVAVFGAALTVLFAFCYLKRRNKLKSSHKPAHEQSNSGPSGDADSRPYTVKELSSITRSFSNSELLSTGAFGDVYKGTPPSGGRLLAVKRIKHENEHGPTSFLAEAHSLRQIRHRNLLQLRGWCEAKEGLFLAHDFMSNSSLDKWLHPKPNPSQVTEFEGLSWNVRLSILAGVASGLEYLHEGWVQCVLHRDIKSSNVMLDADFNAYLGDFGLARLVDHQKLQKTTMPAGTLGYMAPEMHYTGKATKETDVYAFGVLMLEVVCGRRPFMDLQVGDEPGDFLLLEKVWRAHEAGNILKMVDPRLLDQSDMGRSQNNAEALHDLDKSPALVTHGDGFQGKSTVMASVLQWGLLCCLPNPGDRPSMRLVNQWFQSSKAGAMECPSFTCNETCSACSTSSVHLHASIVGRDVIIAVVGYHSV